MSDSLSTTWQEIKARVVAKAWSDVSFKDALLNDPKTTIHNFLQESGQENLLSDNIDIKAFEETTTTVYIIVPRSPTETGELADESAAEIDPGSMSFGMCKR